MALAMAMAMALAMALAPVNFMNKTKRKSQFQKAWAFQRDDGYIVRDSIGNNKPYVQIWRGSMTNPGPGSIIPIEIRRGK